MSNAEIPSHADWKALKKQCGVTDGAVSGIDVGKAIDAFHNGKKPSIKFAKENGELASKLEGVLATYVKKLDKKKVKDYAKFQKKFLDDYVGAAKLYADDFKRLSADVETFKKELTTFFAMVQRLPPNATTEQDLEKFKSVPLRGLSAVGKGVTDDTVDLAPIQERAGKIQKLIEASKGKPAQVIETVRLAIVKLAEDMGKEAKKQNLA